MIVWMVMWIVVVIIERIVVATPVPVVIVGVITHCPVPIVPRIVWVAPHRVVEWVYTIAPAIVPW